MSFKKYIKRGIQYVLHGVPNKRIYAQITTLAPNELLDGRTALITGGTSGIGYEITKAFVNSGATCIITGRNQKKIDIACRNINEECVIKNHIHGILMDNRDVDSFKPTFDKILKICGIKQIDILVNNAGVVGGEIRDCTEELYDIILNTNLKGVFFLTKLVSHYMKDNHIEGNILNVGSSSSLRPATSAYTLSKNAIYGFTRGMAKILSPYNITVNGIAPGPTATPMLMPNGIREDISFPTNPLGRFVMPQEIANMAVFLVSNMGRSIIGDMVFMTGGSGVVTYDDVKSFF